MVWYYNMHLVNTWICEVFSYSGVVLHFILQCLIKVFTLMVSHFLCFLYVAIMIAIVFLIYLSAHLTLVYKKALVLMSLLVWPCATCWKYSSSLRDFGWSIRFSYLLNHIIYIKVYFDCYPTFLYSDSPRRYEK